MAAATPAERDRARRVLVALGRPAGEWLLDNALAATGAEALGTLEAVFSSTGDALLPQLRESLRSDAPVVRRNALRLLAAAGDRGSVAKMREVLAEDGVAFVRRASARALGRLGSAEALPEIERLVRSEDPLDRRAAAEALAGIPGTAALHRLADLLGDESYRVRDPARISLSARWAAALPIGLEELARAKNPALREWLALFRDSLTKAAQPALLRLRLHSDPHVVREAGEILELLEDEKAGGTEGKR